MARARPIPRRTAEIELWDVNPVGNEQAWRREMLQFWSMMLTRGRRVRAQGHLMKVDEKTGANRSRTTDEVATSIAARLASRPGDVVPVRRLAELQRWLEDAVVVPGERRLRKGKPAAAGIGVAHYVGLHLFNRSATRERFWAAFFYSALATDLDAEHATGRADLAGPMLDRFLATGIKFHEPPTSSSNSLPWAINPETLVRRDPEVHLAATALTWDAHDGLGNVQLGLSDTFFSTASPARLYSTFLCPGTIILLRRALRLLLKQADRLGHAAMAELVDAALALHAALYFLRGMHAVNRLFLDRSFPESHGACWQRYQGDVSPAGDAAREARWRAGDYRGAAERADAEWVTSTCTAGSEIFVNAGRKELGAAKELARLSLEQLRRELSAYTVNRILLSLALDVGATLAGQLQEPRPTIPDILRTLDRWGGEPANRMALSVVWANKIEVLRTDADIPGNVLDELPARLASAGGDPRALEEVARYLITETILTSRASGRYVELLHSLLGGGALPSNEDPKGFMARGGTRSVPFHMSVNDRALEVLVAIASSEAEERGDPLSFQGFVDFLAARYGLLIDQAPANLAVSGGLVAEATMQSRAALRARLNAMGLLREFSDSSGWNRVRWGRGI